MLYFPSKPCVYFIKLWVYSWEYTSQVHTNCHIFSLPLFNSKYHFLALSQETHSITSLLSQMDPTHRYWNMIRSLLLREKKNSPSNSNKKIFPWIHIFSLPSLPSKPFLKDLVHTTVVISSPPTVKCWKHSGLASITFLKHLSLRSPRNSKPSNKMDTGQAIYNVKFGSIWYSLPLAHSRNSYFPWTPWPSTLLS